VRSKRQDGGQECCRHASTRERAEGAEGKRGLAALGGGENENGSRREDKPLDHRSEFASNLMREAVTLRANPSSFSTRCLGPTRSFVLDSRRFEDQRGRGQVKCYIFGSVMVLLQQGPDVHQQQFPTQTEITIAKLSLHLRAPTSSSPPYQAFLGSMNQKRLHSCARSTSNTLRGTPADESLRRRIPAAARCFNTSLSSCRSNRASNLLRRSACQTHQ